MKIVIQTFLRCPWNKKIIGVHDNFEKTKPKVIRTRPAFLCSLIFRGNEANTTRPIPTSFKPDLKNGRSDKTRVYDRRVSFRAACLLGPS